MTYRLIVEPDVEIEIEEAADWYGRQFPELAADFLRAIDEALTIIREAPFQYQVIWKTFRRVRIGNFSYILIYRVSGHAVIVSGCFHTSRDPTHWQGRLPR